MVSDIVVDLRKIGQKYAYTALQMHEAIARKAGFNATDHKYLGFFLQREKLTAGELAEITGLTTGAVTGLIDRFEAKKLVKRQFDASDRRKVFIVPNKQKIKDLLVPLYQKYQDSTDKLIASFSENEIEVIKSFLLQSVQLMEETTSNIND